MSKPLVLIVDDEPALRTLFRVWLASRGYEVVTAVDGVHALSIVEERGLPDAAVIDVHMPRMDGLTLCRRLKELEPGLPTVVVSALVDFRPAAHAEGADAVLDKAEGLSPLCDAVDAALQPRPARTTLRRAGPVAQLVRAGDS
jgi:two-component system response regulator MprA